MRVVHEKTLAMLYRGQKNVANNNAEHKQGRQTVQLKYK